MILVLTVITAVASAAVGGVYILTKEPIQEAKLAKTDAAIAEVMPRFDNSPSSEAIQTTIDGQTVNIYPAKQGGKIVGYAVESLTNNGFSGLISLLVGFTPQGKITKIAVLAHKETPGLGDKIEAQKSKFSVQFQGADPSTMKLAIKKDGGDIDAITASTISSRAFIDAVQRAYRIFQNVQSEQQ